MLEKLFLHYKSVIKILVISIVIISVHIQFSLKYLREHIKANWKKYRSHPFILPIAGILNPKPGESIFKTTLNNFIMVISNLVKSFVKILMKPIYAIMKIYVKIFKVIGGVLDKIRVQFSIIRQFLFKLIENIYIRIQNGTAAITYLFLKIREGMKRSFGLFNLVLSIIEHSIMFFESMVKGPIGSFGKMADILGWISANWLFFPAGQAIWSYMLDICFSPDTVMDLNNGYKRVLSDIEIGDVLKGNHKVIAKLESLYDLGYIYNLNGVIVTESHVVNYKDHWIRVKNHPDAEKIKYNKDKVICLVTDTGYITVGNDTFKDYLDTHDMIVHRELDRIIQTSLNHGNDTGYSNSKDLLTGIPASTKILNTDITGFILIDQNYLDMYEIDKQLVSSNMLVLENGSWIRAYEHSRAIHIGKSTGLCIHYITASEKVLLDNGLILRDFVETRDHKINNIMDYYIDSKF